MATPLPSIDMNSPFAQESNTARILAVTGVFFALAVLFVSLRLYTRLVLVRAPGVDDGLIVASIVGPPAPDASPSARISRR